MPCPTWDPAALLLLQLPVSHEEPAVVSWDRRVLSADGVVAPSQEHMDLCHGSLGSFGGLNTSLLPLEGQPFGQSGPGWMPCLKCAAEDFSSGELYAQKNGNIMLCQINSWGCGFWGTGSSLVGEKHGWRGDTGLDSRGSWTRELLREEKRNL